MEKIRTRVQIKHELGRALLGEFVGTAILVLVINTVVAQNVVIRPPGNNALININLGVGLGIALGVAISAKLSGGHINPAVSIGFLALGQLKPIRFLLYYLVQLAGAFVGAALAYLVYRDAINVFDGGVRAVVGSKATAGIFASYPGPHLSAFGGLVDQIVATAFFLFFILHFTDKRNHYPNWTQPLLIGLTFVTIGTMFAGNAGYPCNPARDFGPRLFTFIIGYGTDVWCGDASYCWFWVPIVGPLIGGVLGAYLYQFAIGYHIPAETEYEVVVTRELQPLTKEGEVVP
jgi:MIP family channel proteins